MSTVTQIAPEVGVKMGCEAIGLPRATYYSRLAPKVVAESRTHRSSPRALGPAERQSVLDELHADRFIDQAPAAVHAQLLEEGRYLCSVRTMYRLLEEQGEVHERRNQRVHPPYTKPELLATGPNQVWSWDITKLRGPLKWRHYHLYVILDIFSRYIVGWMIAERESAMLAERLIGEAIAKQGIVPEQLALHADRGTSMTSKAVAQLLADLGVTKSHSRPHVSDDNPFSEAQFKTLKYCPQFPGSFGSLEDARSFCRTFFDWYNQQHHHSGIGYFTPEQVHYGIAAQIQKTRQQALTAAYAAHPERFVNGHPAAPPLPEAAWINRPADPPKPYFAKAEEADRPRRYISESSSSDAFGRQSLGRRG